MKQFYYLLLLLFTTLITFSVNAQHFQTVFYPSNPYNPMNIIVSAATIDGTGVVAGDEIAVFAIEISTGNEICVGTTVLTSGSGPFFVNAGANDPTTPSVQDGFNEGQTIIYRFWDVSESMEITLTAPTYQSGFSGTYSSFGTTFLTSLMGYSVNTWTGSVSNAWNSTGNWSTGLLTNAGANVVIPAGLTNYPTLSAAGACNNITLEADATGYASILGNNQLTVNGTTTVETFISSDKWHIVSPPVNAQMAGTYYLGGTPNVYLMDFTESTNSYNYISDNSTMLNNMEGYLLWVNTDDQIYAYSGTMNSGPYGADDNLSRSNQGWNLVGNPYPSSIDWDAASGWTKTNTDNAIYILNNGNWASYVAGIGTNGGTRYIAPGQGFFVRVSNGNTVGTLKMTNTIRLHNNTPFLAPVEEPTYIRLLVEGNGLSDETVIQLKENATAGFDSEYDALKKFSLVEEYPQIYTTDEEDYSINSSSSLEKTDMSVISGVGGEFSIRSTEINNIGEVWLEDKLTGSFTKLNNSDYTFLYNPNDEASRFVIHFGPVSVPGVSDNSLVIYSMNNQIIVKSLKTKNGLVTVYNLLGQAIANGEMNGLMTNISVNQAGYYLVTVTTETEVVTKKVLVTK